MKKSKKPAAQSILVESLEQRIAPAALLNPKAFTSVTVGGTILLDASDPHGFQGISTGAGGTGQYLLYITSGKALVYTSDLNGDHILEANEITGISAGVDSNGRGLDLISFVSIHGDIITNLLPGKGVSALTDSDNNPANGRDGRVLLDNTIHSITLRSITAADLDQTIPGNTVANRTAPTTDSIFGNIYTGGDFGGLGAGLTIDALAGTHPYVEGIYTGTAADNQHFTLTYGIGANVQGQIVPFVPAAGEHGGDITGVSGATSATVFDIDVLSTGAGGVGARGGNIAEVVLHGDRGGYQILTGDGGSGATAGNGGSIINFNDLGTVTSEVIIHTGNGGDGLLGQGGSGGIATFATSALAADVQIYLGNGGDGVSGGGNGDGLTSGTFQIPESPIPQGGSLLGTYHDIGDIANQQYLGKDSTGHNIYAPHVIDFDGDGKGDAVYTTTNPDQIVLLFGNGTGGFTDNTANFLGANAAKTIYLDAPGVILSTVTVADVNGDGRPDIIAASSEPGADGGIYVFLNQIGDNVHNPIGTSQYTHNPLGDHPFSSPYITPIPTAGPALTTGSTSILALAAGDFNHDGIIDIGYLTGVTGGTSGSIGVMFGHAVPGAAAAVAPTYSLTHNAARPLGTGYFYANSNPSTTTPAILQNLTLGGATILKASAQVATAPGSVIATSDSLYVAALGDQRGGEVLQVPTSAPGQVSGEIGLVSSFSAGDVDTNREASYLDAKGNIVSNVTTPPVFPTILDFSIQDFNGDGVADIVVLTKSPANYLTTSRGVAGVNGAGNTYVVASDSTRPLVPGDNDGYQLDNGTGLKIQPIETMGTGNFDQVAVLSNSGIAQYSVNQRFNVNPMTLPTNGSFTFNLDNPVAFDAYYDTVSPTRVGLPLPATHFGAIDGLTTGAGDAIVVFTTGFTRYETDNGIRILGGAGGESTTGPGGNGGTLGATLTASIDGTATGSLQIIYPASAAYRGEIILDAGSGGDGFAAGGAGGNITGVSTRYVTATVGAAIPVENSIVRLVAGTGGNGVIGNGGDGGSITQFSVASGEDFLAGNAGIGINGGSGGNIVGNGTNGALPDTTITGSSDTHLTIIAGRGGEGSLLGGNGGSIDTVHPVFMASGPLAYISGNGGAAAAGIGGNGGQIINSSPDASVNVLANAITLFTGSGGSGLIGGSGGAITNFDNQSTTGLTPTTVNVATGNGGIGISGDGGVGGIISGLSVNGLGFSLPAGFAPTSLMRVLAGSGGASYGGAGGTGGSITNSDVTAVSTAIVVTAGSGGAGLAAGGAGGSIDNNLINSAALNIGKILVIAGAGGDASAAMPSDISIAGDSHTGDLAHAVLAFGGASAIGGDGGSITRFTQPVSTETAVDLIAGNGGSTLNYGSSLSATTGVGQGGSIDTVNVAGTIGAVQRDMNLNYNPPIQSYLAASGTANDVGTYTTFIQTNFLGLNPVNVAQVPGARGFTAPAYTLDNAAGNVGIVAGVAGSVAGGQPARDGINGSVQNVTASSVMSIVAGSVDRVSPVQILSNITATNLGGVLGADKSLLSEGLFGAANGVVEYYNTNGQIVPTLQSGYRLLDGALYARTIEQPASGAELAGPRIFAAQS